MNEDISKFRTVFVGELVQKTGLSTGGRDGDLYADAMMARDGLDRPILRASGLTGALLATLDDLGVDVPAQVSRRLPEESDAEDSTESLWLVQHAHLVDHEVRPIVRPNVAIHPWTGAAVDGLYFSTEVMPRGTRWKFVIETDDWRESAESRKCDLSANQLLALALREWMQGGCWLGRSPARGLGWARLEDLMIYKLSTQAVKYWPDSNRTAIESLDWLADASSNFGVEPIDLLSLIPEQDIQRRGRWRIYCGKLSVGESALEEGTYGLDTLSTLARDFPLNREEWQSWCQDMTTIDGREIPAEIELDAVPAWTQKPGGEIEFMIPGSAIRGAWRAALSAHWRRAGHEVWAPNGLNGEPLKIGSDPLLPLFGSINHESNILISDAWPVGAEPPQVYIQELHAEDEFTQGPYGSSKFNRPCLVSGRFEFEIAVREAMTDGGIGLDGDQLMIANQVIEAIKNLGVDGMLPIGGGTWRGHGWLRLALEELEESSQRSAAQEQSSFSEAEKV